MKLALYKYAIIIIIIIIIIIMKDSRYYVVVSIVGVLAQFLWEAQAHKVSGRYIIGNC